MIITIIVKLTFFLFPLEKVKSRIPRLNNYYSLAPTSDLNTISVTKAVQLSSRK